MRHRFGQSVAETLETGTQYKYFRAVVPLRNVADLTGEINAPLTTMFFNEGLEVTSLISLTQNCELLVWKLAREIGKDTFIPEVNHHPSWSPDGEQIVFTSNRTGKFQIWIMNRDGTEQRLLRDMNPYNEWDPVWVKTSDPPPPLFR